MTAVPGKFTTSGEIELEDKFIDLPTGLRTRYVEYGPADGPVLLLTHGFLRSLHDWHLNIRALSENSLTPRRIIAVDWPGFGLSDKGYREYSLHFYAAFLREFVTALGLRQFDMMGHSMGGKYGLAFMILNPGFVQKLVLVDTDALIKDPWWTPHTTKRWFQPISATQFKMLGNVKFLKVFANQIVEDKAFVPNEEVLIEEARLLSAPKQLEAIKAMNYHYPKLSMRATGLIERMNEVKNPTLIIWGRQDKIVNVSCADETKRVLKNSQLHIYEKCGHLPFLEKMEHFNRMVLDFLDKE